MSTTVTLRALSSGDGVVNVGDELSPSLVAWKESSLETYLIS